MARRVLKDQQDRPDLRARTVQMEPQDLKVLRGLKVRQVQPEPQDQTVPMVQMERRFTTGAAHRVPDSERPGTSISTRYRTRYTVPKSDRRGEVQHLSSVQPARPDLKVQPDLPEQMARMERPDLKDRRVLMVQTVRQVHRDHRDLPVLMGLMEPQAQRVRRDLSD